MKNLSLLVLSCLLSLGSIAAADLLAYDGFEAGGTSPSAGQYQSEPASSNGTDNDSLIGQDPSRTGFSANGWTSGDLFASSVYPRVNSGGLAYTDSNGRFVQQNSGSAEIFREGSVSGSEQIKAVSRDFDGTAVGTGEPLYISALFRFAAGSAGRVTVATQGSLAGTRENFFGFNSSGELTAGTGSTSGTSSTIYAADTTHFVVAEFLQDGGTRPVNLWIDPEDLTNLGAADHSFSANYFNDDGPVLNFLNFQADTGVSDSSFIADEIRVGNTRDSVVVSAIPEPGTLALMGIALGSLLLFRRRK